MREEWYDFYKSVPERILQHLSRREQFVLDQRINKGKVLREVGEELGLTRERVRQIQNRAVDKLVLLYGHRPD